MENTDKQLSFKFEKGGSLGAKYITRQQINTITIAGKDANLTYKVSDVLNGAYTLKDGGNLSKFAKYIPLKSIVKVQLRDGKNIKPINGYWLKSTAKPIRISKFEEGGNINDLKNSLKMDFSFRNLLFPNEKQFFLKGDTTVIENNRLIIITDGKREIVFSRHKTKLKKLGNATQSTKELFNKKFEGGGNIDLFQDYNKIPKNVNLILEKNIAKFGDEFGAMDFADIKKMQKEVEKLGYTFDYDMDGSIYGLRPINVPLNHLEGYEDEYAKGGNIEGYEAGAFKTKTTAEKNQKEIKDYFGQKFLKSEIINGTDDKGNYGYLVKYTLKKENNYARGGAVFKKSLKPVYSKLVDYYRTEKIKDWYIKNYPTDDLGDEINNVNTFEDLWNGINNHKNVYTIIGVDDSLIRERLFQNLSLIYDVDYNYVYKKWLENTDDFARGGAIKQSSKIERKVAEVNSLIREAFDNQNDPLYVYDPTSTWESPMIYKEVIYKNGRLYIEYYEPYSSFDKIQKEVINKSNMEEDGYPTLLYIAKMYRKAIRRFKSGKYNNEEEDYKNGGSLNKSDNDLKLAYLTDLWFAVHQKESKGYNKIGKELDKLNVPYSVQNSVSDDAFENRGRKNPSVSEVKLFINKILTKNSSFANGGKLGSKPKFKVGDMVYSYQNKTEKRPISYINESSDSTYDHKYKLSLIDGYSNWIDEKSISNTTMMKDGGSINKSITFKDWKGDIRVGVITEKLPNGYEVLTDNGVALVKDNEIID